MYFENFDIQSVVTPVKVDVLDRLLRDSNYDSTEREFLVQGFKEGFDIGYAGPQFVQRWSPNLKITVGSETILWNKVMKEVSLNRYAGPYLTPPYEYFTQSPIGLVPKDGGRDTRLIFHLSYPRSGESVNSCTPKELCSVDYPDFSLALYKDVWRKLKTAQTELVL